MRSRKRDGSVKELTNTKYSIFKYIYEIDMKESEPYKKLMSEKSEKNVGKRKTKILRVIRNKNLQEKR